MRLVSMFATAGVVVLLAGVVTARRAPVESQQNQASKARPPTPQWQIDAGGKMAFDVVSVKPNTAAPTAANVTANMAMGSGDYFSPTGGLFSATNTNLFSYIGFAYKLTGNQVQPLRDEAPKWIFSERFDIQARVVGNPTKDQFRLMMQALLADRFKLAVRWETRQLPVFGLVLDKAGKTGPGLQPHDSGAPCPTDPALTAASSTPATVAACGGIQPLRMTPGRVAFGGRKVTMELIASSLRGPANLERSVIDKTGLSGTFDFRLGFSPEFDGPPPPGFRPDPDGPTFGEALKEQLGLKLVPQTDFVEVLVIDHVEEPSPN